MDRQFGYSHDNQGGGGGGRGSQGGGKRRRGGRGRRGGSGGGGGGGGSGGPQGQYGQSQPHSQQAQSQPQGYRPDSRPQERQDQRLDSRMGNRQQSNSNQILDVDGDPMVLPPNTIRFEDLTSIDPQPRLTLEYPGCPASCRLIDLFCPIGRGQRALIVSPPKAGKTTLLKDIGTSLLRNHPEIELVVLLIDERPEEVTDFRRHFAQVAESLLPPDLIARGEEAARELGLSATAAPVFTPKKRVRVLASSNDHNTEKHIEVAMTTIERCKKMVEAGKHVVVLLDSITRLGRAFNQSRRHANSGRTMTGGLDSKALEVPRALFGAARNTEEAGSLTIIGSCLVDTGSEADKVIFEEFKGSGNMELILDRKIAEARLFPAINLAASGTRKENLLLGEKELITITALRRQLLTMHPTVQIEKLLAAVQRTPNNAALLG